MGEYRCQECSATFDNEVERDQHNRTVHLRYRCGDCDEIFGSEAELASHDRMSHPERYEIS